ncbi:MAG: hypothetical protein BMS9Abin12_0200 [Acidimicrobiia bacterium]|nr:MAG: hypothetical protein BMS9Abin12_0200 [Acidimicrobiia bacterium]
MQTYDLIVAAIVVAFVVRGWTRGLLREALEVAVLLVGIFLVFRLSPVVGSIISGMANVPFEVARIVAGVVLFFVLVIGGALVARMMSAMLRVVPGATVLNRIGGSLIGAAYATLVIVLATTLASVVPMPSGVRGTVDGSIGASQVGRRILEPTGPIQQTVSSVSGEEVFTTVIAIQEAVGARLAAGTIPIPLPGVGDSPLPPSQLAAQQVFDSLNRTRIVEGLDPLGWSGDLAVVAVTRASAVYRSGRLALDDDLAESIAAQGLPGTINTEMVALAATPEGVVEALRGAAIYKAAILDRQYRKAGIGIIDGPYGLLAVQVLSG